MLVDYHLHLAPDGAALLAFASSSGHCLENLPVAEFQKTFDLALTPTLDGEELFFVFKDRTAPRETYGAGRFLNTDMPKDGAVVVDFNQAYNPPCAFTPYATCPLPPPQNRLPVAIEAGEMNYGEH